MGGVLHYQSRGPIARCFWKGPRGQPSRGFAGRRSLSRDLCLGQWMLGCQDRSHRGSSHKSRLRPHGWFLAPPPPEVLLAVQRPPTVALAVLQPPWNPGRALSLPDALHTAGCYLSNSSVRAGCGACHGALTRSGGIWESISSWSLSCLQVRHGKAGVFSNCLRDIGRRCICIWMEDTLRLGRQTTSVSLPSRRMSSIPPPRGDISPTDRQTVLDGQGVGAVQGRENQ